MQETRVRSLGWEDPLEEGMTTHSSFLAWKFHRLRILIGYSRWGLRESDTTEQVTLSEYVLLFSMPCCLPFSVCKERRHCTTYCYYSQGLHGYQMNSLTSDPETETNLFSALTSLPPNKLPPSQWSQHQLPDLGLCHSIQNCSGSSCHFPAKPLPPWRPSSHATPTVLWASTLFITSRYSWSFYSLLIFPGYFKLLFSFKIFFNIDPFKIFIEFVTILLLFSVLGFWAPRHVGSYLPNSLGRGDLHSLQWKAKS